jgi:hypothetical protein
MLNVKVTLVAVGLAAVLINGAAAHVMSCKTTLVMPERYKVINSIVRSVQPEPADPNERPPWE